LFHESSLCLASILPVNGRAVYYLREQRPSSAEVCHTFHRQYWLFWCWALIAPLPAAHPALIAKESIHALPLGIYFIFVKVHVHLRKRGMLQLRSSKVSFTLPVYPRKRPSNQLTPGPHIQG
jgi:hypothetical protein